MNGGPCPTPNSPIFHVSLGAIAEKGLVNLSEPPRMWQGTCRVGGGRGRGGGGGVDEKERVLLTQEYLFCALLH